MRSLALTAIGLYQRYISPRKGFTCAYRLHTRRSGCSGFGYRAIRRYSVVRGIQLIRARTLLCGVVHRHSLQHAQSPKLRHQQGFCDVGCDGTGCDFQCDLPSGKSLPNVCNFLSCCDCGASDWSNKKRRQEEVEKYVHIPPSAWRPDSP